MILGDASKKAKLQVKSVFAGRRAFSPTPWEPSRGEQRAAEDDANASRRSVYPRRKAKQTGTTLESMTAPTLTASALHAVGLFEGTEKNAMLAEHRCDVQIGLIDCLLPVRFSTVDGLTLRLFFLFFFLFFGHDPRKDAGSPNEANSALMREGPNLGCTTAARKLGPTAEDPDLRCSCRHVPYPTALYSESSASGGRRSLFRNRCATLSV